MEKTMYQKILIVTAMLWAIFYSSVSSGEEKIFANDPIIITAVRDETLLSKEGKSVSIVTEEDIKKSGKKILSDVLETIPGVTIGKSGNVTNVYIRGSKSGNVLLMIDGVKVSDPTSIGNVYDIFGLRTENIERIEVIRGAMSSIYGAEASGGVINIITKKGLGKKVVIAGEAGANKTFSESVSVSDSTDKSTFFFSGSHYKTDGISCAKKQNSSDKFDDDGFENYTVSGKLTTSVRDNIFMNFMMNYSDSKSDIDDGSYEDDPNRKYMSKLFSTRGELKHNLFSWWTYKFGVSYMSFTRENIDQKDSIDTDENDIYSYDGSNSKIDLMTIFKFPDFNTLTLGADLLDEKGGNTSSYYDSWAAADEISIFEEKSIVTKSFFVHDALNIVDILILNGGARVDDHEVFGAHWTWDASAAFIVPVTKTKFKGSVGTGFRAPSLSELYGEWGGNDQLKPEKSFVYDAGIYQELFDGVFSVDCSYFVQEYKDKIIYNTAFEYENLDGTVSNKGVETSAVIKAADFLKAAYNYTYIKYEKNDDNSATLKRPRHKHSALVTLTPFNGLDITGIYLFVDKRYDYLTSTTNVKLDPYHRFDINIRYAINEMFTITARGENLTDEDYMETYGYNTKERSFYGGLELVL